MEQYVHHTMRGVRGTKRTTPPMPALNDVAQGRAPTGKTRSSASCLVIMTPTTTRRKGRK